MYIWHADFNYFGPGQLDHFSFVHVLGAAPGADFVPTYKRAFSGWLSSFTGSGIWSAGSDGGFGYSYTYVPAKFYEAIRNEDPEYYRYLHDVDFGSYYGETLLTAFQDQDYDDSVDMDVTHPIGFPYTTYYTFDDDIGYHKQWKQHLEVRRFIAQREFALPGYEEKINANDLYLTTMYGGPRYDSFQADVVAGRYGRILDETLRPRRTREYSADTYEIVSAADDRSSVDIDARTGNVSLRETQTFSPVGLLGEEDNIAVLGLPENPTARLRWEIEEAKASSRFYGGYQLFPPQFGTPEYEALPSWQQEDVRLLQDARELEAADLVRRREQEEAIAAAAAEQNEAMQNVPAARVQELVDEGMAVYVEKTWHSARQVHHNPKGYVVVTDVIGGVVKTVVLEARGDRIGYYRTVWKSPGFELPEDTSVERVAELLADRRTEHRAKLYVDAYVLDPKRIQGAQNTAAALTFVLHLIPGGAFADHSLQGQWGEAGLAFAGDLATLFAGPLARLSSVGRLGNVAAKITAHRNEFQMAAVAIEGTIGGVRLGQYVYELRANGDQATGYLGEAMLRLFGLSVNFRSSLRGGWRLGPGDRGIALEPRLGKNTPYDMPYLDAWDPVTGTAVSIKTLDIQRPLNNLESSLRGWVRDLAHPKPKDLRRGYIQRGDIRVSFADIDTRVLRVGIEPGLRTSHYQELFDRIREYGREQGIDFVEFVEVK